MQAFSITTDSLEEHPAVVNWCKLHGDHAGMTGVQTIQQEKRKAVYRLLGAGPSNSDIIAKRCRVFEAVREYHFYETILENFPCPALRPFGMVNDEDGVFAWLFIENANGESFSPFDENHRSVAARWLGVLHSSGAKLSGFASELRDRGPDHFHSHLPSLVRQILENLHNPALDAEDRAVLEKIISQCEVLEVHWSQLEGFCQRVPQTVVHGDFKPENMCVRVEPDGRSLIVFDWNKGGWGIPALDIANYLRYHPNPDIPTYCSVMREGGMLFDLDTFWRVGYVGVVFVCLASIRWEAERLRYEWVKKPMSKIKVYEDWLDKLIHLSPWDEDRPLGDVSNFSQGPWTSYP